MANDKRLTEKILKLIQNGVTNFLCGGMGHFDTLCAVTVHEIQRKTHDHISCVLVIPYPTKG